MDSIPLNRATTILGHLAPAQTTRICDLIKVALADSKLFPKLLITVPVSSSRELNSSPPFRQLCRLFSDAQLPSRLGFNPGTGLPSVSIKLPTEAFPVITSPHQALLWMALGFLPHEDFDPSQLTDSTEEVLDYAEPKDCVSAGNTLANQCLKHFGRLTGVTFIKRRVEFETGDVTLTIDSIRNQTIHSRDGTMLTDNMFNPYFFAPAYMHLTGCDRPPVPPLFNNHSAVRQSSDLRSSIAPLAYTNNCLHQQKQRLAARMVQEFWAILFRRRYLADSRLQAQVTTCLLAFFESGIDGPAQSFSPTGRPFILYLHGSPGIGKSSFVAHMQYALERVVSLFLEPGKPIHTVRVPLNAMTPESLNAILRIRGISDWSVERILEQSIAKGGLAVMHLEESPAGRALQSELFTLCHQMVTRLLEKYPEYFGNVIYVVTSNHDPAPALIAKGALRVEMAPPAECAQHNWCRRTLHDAVTRFLQPPIILQSNFIGPDDQSGRLNSLKKTTCSGSSPTRDVHPQNARRGLPKVVVDLQISALPLATRDLRTLDEWCLSLAFAIARRVRPLTATFLDVEDFKQHQNQNSGSGRGGYLNNNNPQTGCVCVSVAKDIKVNICVQPAEAGSSRHAENNDSISTTPPTQGITLTATSNPIPSTPSLTHNDTVLTRSCSDSGGDELQLRVCGSVTLSMSREGMRLGDTINANIRNTVAAVRRSSIGGEDIVAEIGELIPARHFDFAVCYAAPGDFFVIDPALGTDALTDAAPDYLSNPAPGAITVVNLTTGGSANMSEVELTKSAISEHATLKPSPARLDWLGVPALSAGKLLSCLHMLLAEALPCLTICLYGGEEKERARVRTGVVAALRALLQEAKHPHPLHLSPVLSVRGEKDRKAIFGDPASPLLSGLYKFLDLLTNPVYQRREFACVVLQANTHGQFILRELLETNARSVNHRQTIHKRRLLFLVEVDDEVTPQLRSRAQLVLNVLK